MTNAKRRTGRKRWGALVAFLTETMKTSQNERVRMAAAQRLTDILILREQREQLELRRELRAADAPEGDGQPGDSPDALERVQETAEQFLARIAARRTQEIEQSE